MFCNSAKTVYKVALTPDTFPLCNRMQKAPSFDSVTRLGGKAVGLSRSESLPWKWKVGIDQNVWIVICKVMLKMKQTNSYRFNQNKPSGV